MSNEKGSPRQQPLLPTKWGWEDKKPIPRASFLFASIALEKSRFFIRQRAKDALGFPEHSPTSPVLQDSVQIGGTF